jgi:methylisocitrate lyase
MARTDSFAGEGLASVIARCKTYIEAGADAVFADALASQSDFKALADAIDAPILANMTEFGCTDLLSLQQLRELGVSMALYPLTAFRMMNAAADIAYKNLKVGGDQRALIGQMQSRDQLYELLDYYRCELEIDRHHHGD